MNLFDRLVELALQGHEDYAPLRAVVEKELLHQDILREMSAGGLFAAPDLHRRHLPARLLRIPEAQRGSRFRGRSGFPEGRTGGDGTAPCPNPERKIRARGFRQRAAEGRGQRRYWKIRVQTRPEAPNLPSQRINIDICSVASHDPRPRMIANSYGIDMGTGGLVIQAESREEILSDKLIALAERPNRVKNRDIWDIAWLRQQGVALLPALLTAKLEDRKIPPDRFGESMRARLAILSTDESAPLDFRGEMARFLPSSLARQAYAARISGIPRSRYSRSYGKHMNTGNESMPRRAAAASIPQGISMSDQIITNVAEENWSLVLEPKKKFIDIDLREIVRYRDLVWLFVKRDFATVYKQTVLGPLWFIINPLVTTVMYTFVFGNLAKIGTDGVPYLLFYYGGTMLWNYFSSCLTNAADVFTANSGLFGKVYFPRLVVPISKVFSNIVTLGIQFGTLMVFYIYYVATGGARTPRAPGPSPSPSSSRGSPSSVRASA